LALQRLRDAAERAKIELSSTPSTEIQLPFVHTSELAGTLHLQEQFTREVFQGLVADLVQRTLDITRGALDSAGVTPADLDAVLLVGGMTRVTRVQDAVERFFGMTPSRGVHADEAVAVGAAIQASLLAGESRETLLLDVTSHDLGIGVAGGLFDVVIPCDTAIPTSTTKEFTTAQDDQSQVRIVVMQGKSQKANDNELLGEFLLEGLRQTNRGELRIEVKFEISVDGMVSVSARDLETGHAQNLTVTASSGLTDEEIVQMSMERDKNLLASVSTDAVDSIVGVAEGLLHRAEGRYEQILRAGGESVVGREALDKSSSALARCRDALESGDEGRIQDAVNALERIDDFLVKVAERLEER
jgi:molecular chaperone DnaK